MALIEKLSSFLKKRGIISIAPSFNKFRNVNFSSFTTLFVAVTLFSFTFYIVANVNNKKNLESRNNLNSLTSSSEFSNFANFFISKLNSPYSEIKYSIKKNYSIEKILQNFNIQENDIKDISLKLRQKRLTNINSGRELSLVLKKLENGSNSIVNILYPINNTSSVEVRKFKDEFIIKENILKLYKKEILVKNTIKDNLYSSATNVNVEPNIIIEFARIFGFEVDFQRDIRKDDWFEIFYEKFEDENGKVRDTGKIIYASMFVNGEEINLYNFKYKNEEEYFDIKGKSITKSLMKTPINGARLSSSFGMRKHPILGYNKMHRGTDFAAPTGTPIMASGSGTVTRARWCGGGGNCVKIKHNSTYETIYAHMKSFAKGIKEGRKVKQGQIIGYVGSTGLSTGPHLHYEVVVNGKKVNSQKLKLPSGKILKGAAREKFELDRIKIDLKLSELR